MTAAEPRAAATSERLDALAPRVDDLEARVQNVGGGNGQHDDAARLTLELLALVREVDDVARELDVASVFGPDGEAKDAADASRVTSYRKRLDALVAPLARVATDAAALPTVSAPAPAPAGRSTAERRAQRAAGIRSVVGQALTFVGVVVAVFLLYQFVVTDVSESRAQRSLVKEFEADLLAAGQLAAGGGDEAESSVAAFDDLEGIGEDVEAEEFDVEGLTRRLTQPRPGQPIAVLSIPEIDLDKVVVEGTGSTQLARGPGHYRSSSRPGYIGNSVIAAHRTTYGAPFRDLHKLDEGDEITVTTVDGIFEYEVRETAVIRPGQDDVTGPKFENLLTLVTSTPAYRTEHRLAVVAELQRTPVVPSEEQLTARSPAIGNDELGIFRDTTAWTPAVIYFQLLAASWILAKVLVSRWRRWSGWLITTPLVITSGFLFLESAARLLPSTY